MPIEINRVAVLYSRLTGYVSACLKALKEKHEVDLLIYRWASSEEAPFSDETFNWIERLHSKQDYSPEEIADTIENFDPQALLVAGWRDKDYLEIARTLKEKGVPVVSGCDNQWEGTVRQQVGRLIAPWYLYPAFDALWVPGERQRQFAAKLGYTGTRCWKGYYACDWKSFAEVRLEHDSGQEPVFLYAGRYAKEKGLDVLMRAYRQYRSQASNPWRLVCAGSGPQQTLLVNQEGVADKGFVQPEQFPNLLREAAAFILPSRVEPWGVVIQEAAAAGLPVLCSEACGASVHLVQDGYNGFLFETANAEHLSHCMKQVTDMSEERREKMGRRSHELSKQFIPERWARTFVEGIRALSS